MLDVGVHTWLPLRGDHGASGDRLKRDGTDEPRGGARHHGHDIVAVLLQPAADLDGLVGTDTAGDPERN